MSMISGASIAAGHEVANSHRSPSMLTRRRQCLQRAQQSAGDRAILPQPRKQSAAPDSNLPQKVISIPACLSRLYSHKRYLSTDVPVG